jgi:regulatory protein
MEIIRISKKDEQNVVILFEDKQSLIVSKNIIFQNGLRKGDSISEDHFVILKKENERYITKQRAFRLLGIRIHSSFELKIKLLQKKISKDIVEEVIADLQENKFLNDYEYGMLYASERMNNKKYGILKIKSDLFKKGLDATTINKVIEDLEIETSQDEKLFELAKKKYELLKKRNLEEQKIMQKIFSFLISKGYEYNESKEVLNKISINESLID